MDGVLFWKRSSVTAARAERTGFSLIVFMLRRSNTW